MKTLLAADFDKQACATYRANFPDVDVRCAPVSEIISEIPHCDIILGGPPCQPFSLAGRRKGGAEGLLEVSPSVIRGDVTDSPSPYVTAGGADTGGADTGGADTGGAESICHWQKRFVRRLTPDELLRLQSGPDDFQWPHGISKTNKYKIIGNGWACGMAWRLRQAISKAMPELQTCVDLFAGGGLGACGWHGRYWSYTA